MKITVSFEGLENQVRQMGAAKKTWIPDEVIRKYTEVRERLETGVEISLDEVEVTNGNLLSKEGQQIVVYIKDNTFEFDAHKNPAKARRIHLCDCNVLKELRQKGRFDRFVSTVKTEKFPIDVAIPQHRTVEADLHVCQFCLEQLNIVETGANKREISKNFDFEDFFGRFSTFFPVQTKYSDFSAPSSDYTKNWYKRSFEIRKKSDWKCHDCGVYLGNPAHRKILHVHHIDGVKSNNSARNLVALCEICHAKQPSHQHMRVKDAHRRIIEQLRQQQNPV